MERTLDKLSESTPVPDCTRWARTPQNRLTAPDRLVANATVGIKPHRSAQAQNNNASSIGVAATAFGMHKAAWLLIRCLRSGEYESLAAQIMLPERMFFTISRSESVCSASADNGVSCIMPSVSV